MKWLVFVSLALSGCYTPCEKTARYAVAMLRSCAQVEDIGARETCARAYVEVRDALTTGACSSEVTK